MSEKTTPTSTKFEHYDGPDHPEWDMYVQKGQPESDLNPGGVWYQIRDRLVVLDEDEEAPEGVPVFDYEYDEHRFFNLLTDPETGHYEQVPLGQFVRTLPWDLALRGKPKEKDVILAAITSEYVDAHPPPSWWLHLDTVRADLKTPIMQESTRPPTEQFIIGQDGRGVRFFNYGEPMPPERIEDCCLFIDALTQCFGEQVYDVMTDVVFAQLSGSSADPKERLSSGVTYLKTPKVIFANTAFTDNTQLLTEGGLKAHPIAAVKDDRGELVEVHPSDFLGVLVHEYKHLLDNPKEGTESMIELAETLGWDIDGLVQASKQEGFNWKRDSIRFAPPHNTEGVMNSLPSNYSRTTPGETSAEIFEYILLTNLAAHMPETGDAWFEHIQNITARPIATPLDRPPIVVDRRTGDEILYPRTPLPEHIYVRAKLRKPVAA